MRALRSIVFTLALLVFTIAPAAAQQAVRVASYNIKFLSTGVSSKGDRLTKLKQVIALLDADVIGLQEIDDRAALELLFPPADWDIYIDDDSNDDQDVAVVVRHPFTIKAADLNA